MGQYYSGGDTLDRMRQIEDASLGGFKPDLTLIFDIDTHEGLSRTGAMGDEDRIETIGLQKLERARQGFLWQAEQDPERFAVVSAFGGVNEVAQAVKMHLGRLLGPDNHKRKAS